MLLSFPAETDTNLSEASELSMPSGIKITSFSNKSTLKQNRVSLQELVMVFEGYEVSDRAGATTASVTLKAFGIDNEDDRSYVVNRSELRRETQKHKKNCLNWWVPFL